MIESVIKLKKLMDNKVSCDNQIIIYVDEWNEIIKHINKIIDKAAEIDNEQTT